MGLSNRKICFARGWYGFDPGHPGGPPNLPIIIPEHRPELTPEHFFVCPSNKKQTKTNKIIEIAKETGIFACLLIPGVQFSFPAPHFL